MAWPADCTQYGGAEQILSNHDLAALVASTWPNGTVPQTGLSIWDTAYAVARAESRGNVNACGDSGVSVGLWQVYTPAHPSIDRNQLFDPFYNAQVAAAISGNGQNWNAWCTWEPTACGGHGSNDYRAYLAEAQIAFQEFLQHVPPPVVEPVSTGGGATGVLVGASLLLVGVALAVAGSKA